MILVQNFHQNIANLLDFWHYPILQLNQIEKVLEQFHNHPFLSHQ